MKLLLVTYDLKYDETYAQRRDAVDAQMLKLTKANSRVLDTAWIIQTAYTPEQIKDHVKAVLGEHDKLLVTTMGTSAWFNLNRDGVKWAEFLVANV